MKSLSFFSQTRSLAPSGPADPLETILFTDSEIETGDGYEGFTHPAEWGLPAVEILRDAVAAFNLPVRRIPVEENTLPSWLWRAKSASSEQGPVTVETDSRTIFNRVAGSAAYQAWHLNLFKTETDARSFYNDLRYALARRQIAVDPRLLATMGLAWRYGITATSDTAVSVSPTVSISNRMIDAKVGGSRDSTQLAGWKNVAEPKTRPAASTVRFADSSREWMSDEVAPMQAAIDLMALRHNDGTINIDGLRHATGLLTLLLSLQSDAAGAPLQIGFVNLAALLAALALPYDSKASRALAASITAIITAQAYATSAELAELQGAAPAFLADREDYLRVLRNHRRAAYGEPSDYEKIAVVPAALTLSDCPDLALAAAARGGWDEALSLARKYGLRHMQVTTLTASPELTLFMEAASSGLAPLTKLATTGIDDAGLKQKSLTPVVAEGLSRLDYDQATVESAKRHLLGSCSLEKSAPINQSILKKHAFDKAALVRIAAYLPQVDDIRLAFTRHILGDDFCQQSLKIPAAKLHQPCFDLLAHLGFTTAEIIATNAACYGHDNLHGFKAVERQHRAIFMTADEIAAEAKIRMAGAAQALISGSTGLVLELNHRLPAEIIETLVFAAWRQGLHNLQIVYSDSDITATSLPAVQTSGRIAKLTRSAPPALPQRSALRNKSGGRASTGNAANEKPKAPRASWHR